MAEKTSARVSIAALFEYCHPTPKTPSKPIKTSTSPSPMLVLPLELRLQIYAYLTSGYAPFTHPACHPLYCLYFVCKTLQADMVYLFLSKTTLFTFPSPGPCLLFLTAISKHTTKPPNLTSLTLFLPANETGRLEPIFKIFAKTNIQLQRLSLHLVPSPGHFTPRARPTALYMLPRRTGLSSWGAHVRKNWNKQYSSDQLTLFSFNYREIPYSFNYKENFVYTDTPRAFYSWAGKRFGGLSWFARMESLRYLAVYGQALGGLVEVMRFELGVVRLHLGMQELAEREGKKVMLGYGSKNRDEKWWYFDVWIQGEMGAEMNPGVRRVR